MLTQAWQTTALPDHAPERLLRFGRFRRSTSVAIVRKGSSYRVEVRESRKVIERIVLGDRDDAGFADRLRAALEQAHALTGAALLSSLEPAVEAA
jgi:hypothetical protein